MFFASRQPLEPNDLSLLRGVLEQICAEKDIPIEHLDAQTVAAHLINWYMMGLKEPDELKSMIKLVDGGLSDDRSAHRLAILRLSRADKVSAALTKPTPPLQRLTADQQRIP